MTDSTHRERLDLVGLIEEAFLFERDWYLDIYPDVAASGGDPLDHYLMHGVSEGRNPNRLFDTLWYLSAYPELGSTRMNPLVHYILKGAQIGCDPHPFFSSKAYIEKYPEAANQEMTPLANYLTRTLSLGLESFPKFTRYDVIRAIEDNYRRLETEEILRHIDTMIIEPVFIVFVDGTDAQATKATEISLSKQLYRRYVIVLAPTDALQVQPRGDGEPQYLVWLDAGDTLAEDALYRYASAINGAPDIDLIYCDYDFKLDSSSWAPVYKPGWSPDYLECFEYMGSGICARLTRAVGALEVAEGRFDFVLRFTEREPLRVAHVDRILLHAPTAGHALRSAAQAESDISALSGRLARTGRQGVVCANVIDHRCYDINLHLDRSPLVSIIIPTAARVIDWDGEKIDLIAQCVKSIFEVSSYQNIELIIVDNGDLDRDRLYIPDRRRVKFITCEWTEVSIAKKINLGAAYAIGDLILILNDDVKPLTADWIERMVAHFEKQHVGLVGAKLLYPDGTIQHVGVAACDGAPEHVSRGKSSNDSGYVFSTAGVRNYLAVTGAVTMSTAKYFKLVGGYSEEFPIDYNDIDFSYKFAQQGLTVVYEPQSVLMHYESVSFVKKPSRPEDADAFYAKWGKVTNDPYYNEYTLSKHPPTFDIAYSVRRH